MNTDMTWQIESTSSDATEQLGVQLGQLMRGGEVIDLISDLGGGKTTFVRGLARGAGSTDHVASPTFTISKVYKAPKFDIHHFDFYRIDEPGLMEHELHDVIQNPQTITIIEWGDLVRHVLPLSYLTISIKALSDNSRQLSFSCPQSLNYLADHTAGV